MLKSSVSDSATREPREWSRSATLSRSAVAGQLLEKLEKRPRDYFKMFYADTATFGSSAATDCGLAFFGVDKCLFASDCPFDPEGGPMYIRETIKILDELDVTETEREALYLNNAQVLLNLN